MDAQVWQRIRGIFEQASELAPAARSAFLDAACAGDSDVRSEVEALLRADVSARFADAGIAAAAPDLLQAFVSSESERTRDEWSGQRLGAWRLLREIG